MAAFQTSVVGQPDTLEYRVFFEKEGKKVSPFHDIPLSSAEGTFNMIVEIPKNTRAKLEISTKDEMNPIKQVCLFLFLFIFIFILFFLFSLFFFLFFFLFFIFYFIFFHYH